MIPLIFRFFYQFQNVAEDLNGVIVQSRFTACIIEATIEHGILLILRA